MQHYINTTHTYVCVCVQVYAYICDKLRGLKYNFQ